jgi:hypothetical protein
MATYENPAGRLHDLLKRFESQPKKSMRGAWAAVLDVEESDVPFHLGGVASLLADVRRAAADTGSPAYEPMPSHLSTLARSILPVDRGIDAAVQDVLPDATAMQMLLTLSYALSIGAPEERIPELDELHQLQESVSELINDVSKADLPPNVKRVLLYGLAEMLEALEHVEIGGPEGVRRAAESVAAAAAIYAGDAPDQETVGKVATVARKVWTAFAVATAFASAVLTWDKMIDLTGTLGQAQEQRQLPPAPEQATGDVLPRSAE